MYFFLKKGQDWARETSLLGLEREENRQADTGLGWGHIRDRRGWQRCLPSAYRRAPPLVLTQTLFLCRFHKLVWGGFGSGLPENSGVIAGGGDSGVLTLYNVTHILSSGKEPLIAQKQKHTGAVRALDFNPFQVLRLS